MGRSESKASSDTVTIQHDRSKAFDGAAWRWSIVGATGNMAIVKDTLIPLRRTQFEQAKESDDGTTVTVPGTTTLQSGDVFATAQGIYKVQSARADGASTIVSVLEATDADVFDALSIDPVIELDKAYFEPDPSLEASLGASRIEVKSVTTRRSQKMALKSSIEREEYKGVGGVALTIALEAKDVVRSGVGASSLPIELRVGIYPSASKFEKGIPGRFDARFTAKAPVTVGLRVRRGGGAPAALAAGVSDHI